MQDHLPTWVDRNGSCYYGRQRGRSCRWGSWFRGFWPGFFWLRIDWFQVQETVMLTTARFTERVLTNVSSVTSFKALKTQAFGYNFSKSFFDWQWQETDARPHPVVLPKTMHSRPQVVAHKAEVEYLREGLDLEWPTVFLCRGLWFRTGRLGRLLSSYWLF